MSNMWAALPSRGDSRISCVPSPGTADASDVFSQEHVFTGQGDQNPGFSHCEILHCSMKHQVSPVVYRVKKKKKNLPPVFISYIFFLLPRLSGRDTLPILTFCKALPQPVQHSLGCLSPWQRDVATCQYAAVFRCTEPEVMCISVSKCTCFWWQSINMIYFQFWSVT